MHPVTCVVGHRQFMDVPNGISNANQVSRFFNPCTNNRTSRFGSDPFLMISAVFALRRKILRAANNGIIAGPQGGIPLSRGSADMQNIEPGMTTCLHPGGRFIFYEPRFRANDDLLARIFISFDRGGNIKTDQASGPWSQRILLP